MLALLSCVTEVASKLGIMDEVVVQNNKGNLEELVRREVRIEIRKTKESFEELGKVLPTFMEIVKQ